jgi:hypothetical protein|tara:strand:+ start:619 stop:870 length:252 start_codon:yes stop_codon:yes gene_type:complete
MKITKNELQQIIKEELLHEMSSFNMAEDVIELLGSKYNIMEEDVPTMLMAMANSLEDKGSSMDIPPAGKPLSGDQMDKLARDI